MRIRRLWSGVVCAVLVSCGPVSGDTGSEGPPEAGEAPASAPATARAATAPAPAAHGPLFLGPGDCSGRGRTDVREVPCTSEKAAARVIARHDGRRRDGPACPAATDFVLHISEHRPEFDEDGDGSVPRGYACMRNLEPPHPGDPGGGGGPHTVVGDCLHGSSVEQVRETPCDGSGAHRPEFRLESAVDERSRCPGSTDLFVELPVGEAPVGCARRL
ncbi:LppU/SCO3897 family protein [Streptomyces spongiicola]|uniref:LppU/SCO3897 family protein n=1 Tax=Streptomyces spongiicola TaxID=1690221 RepID=UPI003F4CD07D